MHPSTPKIASPQPQLRRSDSLDDNSSSIGFEKSGVSMRGHRTRTQKLRSSLQSRSQSIPVKKCIKLRRDLLFSCASSIIDNASGTDLHDCRPG